MALSFVFRVMVERSKRRPILPTAAATATAAVGSLWVQHPLPPRLPVSEYARLRVRLRFFFRLHFLSYQVPTVIFLFFCLLLSFSLLLST